MVGMPDGALKETYSIDAAYYSAYDTYSAYSDHYYVNEAPDMLFIMLIMLMMLL